MMTKFQNWISYSYDNVLLGPKTSKHSQLEFIFNKKYIPENINYYQSLERNAILIKENFSGIFDVLFSGGIDSELIVRINKKLGIKQNVFFFKLENDLNYQDLSNATKICHELNIKLNIIDFSLEKWIEHDVHNLLSEFNHQGVENLLRLSWFNYLDNIPIVGVGEPYWKRDHWDDFSKKSNWSFVLNESNDTLNWRYSVTTNRPIIDWYLYTPEISMNFHKLPLIQQLIDDKIFGKRSSWSSRREVHLEIFPEIFEKPKLVGYEGRQGAAGQRPDLINNFYLANMQDISNYSLYLSKPQLESLFN